MRILEFAPVAVEKSFERETLQSGNIIPSSEISHILVCIFPASVSVFGENIIPENQISPIFSA